MKFWTALLLGIVLLFGTAAFAQDNPKIEVSANYSYMRFNPQNSNITELSAFSLNGGGALTYFFSDVIGVKAEFEGYGSTTRNLPSGTPVSGNLFTYNVGPVFKYRTGHFQPFAEVLFGGAHSNAFVNICNSAGTVCIKSPSNNAFDFAIGGGVDIPVTAAISMRPAEFDYVLTTFGNGFTSGNNNQSNFWHQAGVAFSF